MDLIGLKSTCREGCIPSGCSKPASVSLAFLAPRDHPHSLAHNPFLPSSKSKNPGPTPSHTAFSLVLPPLLPPFSLKDPCEYTWLTQITQDNLPILHSLAICNLNSPLPYKVYICRFQDQDVNIVGELLFCLPCGKRENTFSLRPGTGQGSPLSMRVILISIQYCTGGSSQGSQAKTNKQIIRWREMEMDGWID